MTNETLSAETTLEPSAPGRVSAVDRLVELIRDFIAQRGLKVGDALPTERELGEAYQAGRNTVREALQVLKAYGIVEARPKVGAVISGGHGDAIRKMFSFHGAISPDSFKDVQGFRRIVEIGIADAVMRRATAQDFAALAQKNLSMLEAATIEERARRDYEFHEAIVELAGNRTMLGVYHMLRPVIEEVMHLGKSSPPAQEQSYEAHLELIDALRKQDRITYAYLMSRHLEYALRFVTGDEAAGPGLDEGHTSFDDGRPRRG
ncbi:DNA-binding transcriptional regulator, FadR family [Bosea sp. OK403]|uniref:FadR/GntR family transcriptional regulator n=1 Tax=Bosea sp. OK403 TaxID=1855286 RepID=UPI0008EC5292|nr:FCD domain-containing protein [Bosea sp. OK403]SFJ15778.1 DNA-binding transcriptional regulator, FadR family [Bosea sp. OK403]